MDRFTFRNLEIFSSVAGKEGVALVDVMDRCSSPMGARMLRTWLAMPVMDLAELGDRYDVVEHFIGRQEDLKNVQEMLGNVGDMERILSRTATGKVLPREVMQLKRGLALQKRISDICHGKGCGPLDRLTDNLSDNSGLVEYLGRMLATDPAAAVGKGM